jgi:hypothetical protein
MGIATMIAKGETAFLIVSQGKKLAEGIQFDLYQLNTPECRLAIWDNDTRSAVVFDAPSLFALAMAEAIEQQHGERSRHESA